MPELDPNAAPMMPTAQDPDADNEAGEAQSPGLTVFIHMDQATGELSVGTIPSESVMDAESTPCKDKKEALTKALEILKTGKLAPDPQASTAGFMAGYGED